MPGSRLASLLMSQRMGRFVELLCCRSSSSAICSAGGSSASSGTESLVVLATAGAARFCRHAVLVAAVHS